jgi:putative redox protein
MQVQLNLVNDAYHMIATNDTGNEVHIDGSIDIGGSNLGVRPMSLLLMGLGSCSAIDVISILKKMKQPIDDLQVEVNGERESVKEAKPFNAFHVSYKLKGDIEPAKAIRAAQLSMEKYCSATLTLEKAGPVTWDLYLNDEKIA